MSTNQNSNRRERPDRVVEMATEGEKSATFRALFGNDGYLAAASAGAMTDQAVATRRRQSGPTIVRRGCLSLK
jgi:hypothetical protein